MFKYEYRNGKLFEIPAEELEQMEKEQRIRDIEETTRPLTEMEVSRIIIQHNLLDRNGADAHHSGENKGQANQMVDLNLFTGEAHAGNHGDNGGNSAESRRR